MASLATEEFTSVEDREAASRDLARDKPRLVGAIPFILMQVAPLGAFFVDEIRSVDWVVCFALYYIRMFGITAGYHRYFSHRAYKVGRVTQFVLAALGAGAAQKGPLWWAAHHRHHHKRSDLDDDVHSPKRGFWYSHVLWIFVPSNDVTHEGRVKEFLKYPEIVWLNNHPFLPAVLLGVVTYLVGGASMLFIGFFLSTALLYHGTFFINSLAHVWGSRRFETTDTSRNNFFLSLLTLGEGWHNNHHHYQSSANQGFYWWEIDISFYIIKAMQAVGLAWDVRKPTEAALQVRRIGDAPHDEPQASENVAQLHAPRAEVREAA
jgi:stearoyl-CoA desaturase (delta-9 desaturase)